MYRSLSFVFYFLHLSADMCSLLTAAKYISLTYQKYLVLNVC